MMGIIDIELFDRGSTIRKSFRKSFVVILAVILVGSSFVGSLGLTFSSRELNKSSGNYLSHTSNEYIGNDWWDIDQILEFEEDVRVVEFSPDNEYLAVTLQSPVPEIHILETEDWSVVDILDDVNDRYRSISWSPEGDYLATGNSLDDPDAIVYETEDWELIEKMNDVGDHVKSVSFSPDGEHLVLGGGPISSASGFFVYDTNDWNLEIERTDDFAWGEDPISQSWTPDGEYLALGMREPYETYIVERNSWDIIEKLDEPNDRVRSVSFNQDGDHLVAGSTDSSVYIYETSTWTQEKTLEIAEEAVNSLSFTSDGNQLAFGSSDNNTYIYDPSDWSLLQILDETTDAVGTLSFSHDSFYLALGSEDKVYLCSEKKSFGGGSGSEEDPYLIENWHHLNNIRKNLSANYALNSSLDENTPGYEEHASETSNQLVDEGDWGSGIIYEKNDLVSHDGKDYYCLQSHTSDSNNEPGEGEDCEYYWVETEKEGGDALGWEPIGLGYEDEDRFGETFDGRMHEIRDLYMDRPEESEVGLFSRTPSRDYGECVGVFKNLIIRGDVTGDYRVGLLIGRAGYRGEGTIERIGAFGSVEGSEDVGGIVGAASSSGTIIRDSFSDVEVKGGIDVGGVTGRISANQVSCRRSYVLGTVSGDEVVGGSKGEQHGFGSDTTDVYSTAAVTSGGSVGGLMASHSHGDVDDSYWDTEASGQDTSDAGLGLTTSEMTGTEAEHNMNFDFDNDYYTVEANQEIAHDIVPAEDGYPILRPENGWEDDQKENWVKEQLKAQDVSYDVTDMDFMAKNLTNIIEDSILQPTGVRHSFAPENEHYYFFYSYESGGEHYVGYNYTDDFETWDSESFNIGSGEEDARSVSMDIKGDEIAYVTNLEAGTYPEFRFRSGTLNGEGSIDWEDPVDVDTEIGGKALEVKIHEDGKYRVYVGGDWDDSWNHFTIWASDDGEDWNKEYISETYSNHRLESKRIFEYEYAGETRYVFVSPRRYQETKYSAVYWNPDDGWHGEHDLEYEKGEDTHDTFTGGVVGEDGIHLTYMNPNRTISYGFFDFETETWSDPVHLDEIYPIAEYGRGEGPMTVYNEETETVELYFKDETGDVDAIRKAVMEDGEWQQETTKIVESLNEHKIFGPSDTRRMDQGHDVLFWTDWDGVDEDSQDLAYKVLPKGSTDVQTHEATNVTHDSATLHGKLIDLGATDEVAVWFEWGKRGNLVNQTSEQTLTQPDSFSADLTNLEPDTTYEFRAVADGDGTVEGRIKTLTTLERADFEVMIDDDESDTEIVEGESFTIVVDVENTGEEDASTNLTVDPVVDDPKTTTVDVAGGETKTEEFTFDTSVSDAETYTVLASEDETGDQYSMELTILEEAYFEVTIDHPSEGDEYIKGDEVTVEYTVHNVGDETDIQNIEFYVDDELIETEEDILLDGGEVYEDEFTWIVEEPYGERDLTVGSEDDLDEMTIEVLEEAYFEVTIDHPSKGNEYVEGDEVTVGYTVDNIGGEPNTQDMEFYVDDELIETEEGVEIEAGEDYQDEFVWTAGEPYGERVLSVRSYEDEDEVTIDVLEEANFEVEIVEYDEEVVEGEDLAVEYTVHNTGEVVDTQDIEFVVHDEYDLAGENIFEAAKLNVTLEGEESFSGQFKWSSTHTDNYSFELFSRDDSEYENFDVVKEPFFEVKIIEYDEKLVEGDELVVNYTIENINESEDAQDIEFTIYDEEKEVVNKDMKIDVVLGPGEFYEDVFTWQTSEGDAGEYDIVVESEDDEAEVDTEVLEDAYFEIDITHYQEDVVEGELIQVNYTVSNTGDVEDTQNVVFFIDDNLVLIDENITLDEDETHSSLFNWAAEEPYQERTIFVRTQNDEDEVVVTVLESAFFEIQIISPEQGNEYVEGEEVKVFYTVNNTGDVKGEDNIVLRVDGEIEEVQEGVTVEGEKTYSDVLTWKAEEPYQERNISVESDDDEDEVSIEVLKDAYFEVEIEEDDQEVLQREILENKGEEIVEGDVVQINYLVNNLGDVAGIQEINFYVDNELIEKEEDIEIEGNSTYEGEFSWIAESSEEERNLSVQTQDDHDETSLEVLKQATFEISELTVEPDETYVEEEFTIEAAIQNRGEVQGEHPVTFYEEGTEIGEETVEVIGGEYKLATLVHDIDESGTYTISVDDPYYEEEVKTEIFVSDHPEVVTLEATDVGREEATLHGEVIEIGIEDEVEAYFRFREIDNDGWTEIDERRTVGSESTFSLLVDELESETTYEFKALIEWGGTEEIGEPIELKTQPEPVMYELDIDMEGEGEIEVYPEKENYEEGVEVHIQAVSDDDFEFVEWSGDVPEGLYEEEYIVIEIDEDVSLTGHFEEEERASLPENTYFIGLLAFLIAAILIGAGFFLTNRSLPQDVLVTAPEDRVEGERGRTYTYDFIVENQGEKEDTFKIEVDSTEDEWKAKVTEEISIKGESEVEVPVEVTIPEFAEDGEKSKIALKAVSHNDPDISDHDVHQVGYNPLEGDDEEKINEEKIKREVEEREDVTPSESEEIVEKRKRELKKAKLRREKEKRDEERSYEEDTERAKKRPKEKVVEEFKEIKGVSDSTAANLYEAGYTSLDDLKETSTEELTEVEGVGIVLAELIKKSIEEPDSEERK